MTGTSKINLEKTVMGLKPLTTFASSSVQGGWVRLSWALNSRQYAIEFDFFFSNQMSFSCPKLAQQPSNNSQSFFQRHQITPKHVNAC